MTVATPQRQSPLQGLGLERIQTEMVFALVQGLPDELDRLADAYSGWDLWAQSNLQNEELAPMHLEHPVSYFPGHRRSMIDLPYAGYPIITALAYQFQRDPLRDTDQYDAGLVTAYVEGIVKGDTQGSVNRAVQRYAEACHNVLGSSTLNGAVEKVPIPSVTIYDEVDRTEGSAPGDGFNDATGRVWWWQGFRLQYQLPTYHTFQGVQTVLVPAAGITDEPLIQGTY